MSQASVQKIESADIIDLLAHLSDRSLVSAEELGPAPRYRLLETVRQYARDLLADDKESITFHQRHLDHFAMLAHECEPKMKGREQLAAHKLLDEEYENLRVALERGTSGEGSETVLGLAADLVIFWWRQGHMAEGMEWCLRAAATPFGTKRTVFRARVLNGAGLLSGFQGDCATGKKYFEESHEILKELGDRKHLGETLCGIGFMCFFLDEYADARKYTEAAYAVSKEVNNLWYTAWTGYFLGIISRVEGDFEAAIRLYEEAISIYRKLGDRIGASYPIYDIGLAEYYRGNLEPAHRYLSESLVIRQETGDLWGVAESLFGLGLVALAQKNLEEAKERLRKAKATASEVGDKTRNAISAHWLGQILLSENAVEDACEQFDESFVIYQSLEDRWGLAHCLAASASLAAHHGDWAKAVQLWFASDRVREEIGSPLPPMERAHRDGQLCIAREKIGDSRFEEMVASGRDLELQSALEIARPTEPIV